MADRCLASGFTDTETRLRIKALGWDCEESSVGEHRGHWESELEHRGPLDVQLALGTARGQRSDGVAARDLAILVRDRAIRHMEAGDLEVDVKDGLRAQAMIDTREAREADRSMTISMARMLHATPAPPPKLIEGDVTDAIADGSHALRPPRAPRAAQATRTSDRSGDDAELARIGPGRQPVG